MVEIVLVIRDRVRSPRLAHFEIETVKQCHAEALTSPASRSSLRP